MVKNSNPIIREQFGWIQNKYFKPNNRVGMLNKVINLVQIIVHYVKYTFGNFYALIIQHLKEYPGSPHCKFVL